MVVRQATESNVLRCIELIARVPRPPDTAPGQRVRFEQRGTFLESLGIEVHQGPFTHAWSVVEDGHER